MNHKPSKLWYNSEELAKKSFHAYATNTTFFYDITYNKSPLFIVYLISLRK